MDRNVLILGLLVVPLAGIAVPGLAADTPGSPWQPPIGIPAPTFGMDETAAGIYGAGFLTHYVDNTHPAATDEGNPKGTPATPRKSIPEVLPAGSVVEVHGGPYIYRGSRPEWTLDGTKDRPVFIRGADGDGRIAVEGLRVRFKGQYYVVEDLEFRAGSRLALDGAFGALRDCEVSDSRSNPTVTAAGTDIVIHNNEIHHNVTGPDRDCHATYAPSGAKRVWVVDNHLHHNSGDSFQAGHQASIAPQYLYIGRNRMHEDRENAVDIKVARDVIISQNVMYGYKRSNTSGGDAIRINDEGAQDSIWILFNHIYDSRWGIAPYGCDAPPYIIGNLIHDCDDDAVTAGAHTVAHNTIYNAKVGVAGAIEVESNIFCNIRGLPIEDPQFVRNNLLWQNGRPFARQGCVEADPRFVDAEKRDFHLRKDSPAIDAGSEADAYGMFKQRYGIDIRVDFDGNPRPAEGDTPGKAGWDIGAFEYAEL